MERLNLFSFRNSFLSKFLTFTLIVSLSSPAFALAPRSQVSEAPPKSMPFPLYFPPQKKQGEHTDQWLREQLLVSAILDLLEEDQTVFSFMALKERAEIVFQEYGRSEPDGAEINHFLKKMKDLALLEEENQNYSIKTTPDLLAVWADDVEWIGKKLEEILNSRLERNLYSFLEQHAHLASLQPLYPLETQYPFRRAVTLLSPKEKALLAIAIARLRDQDLYKKDLINALDLQLNGENAQTQWISRVAPVLKDVRIYDVSPEFSEVSGGLGRVQQYHITGMHKLGASIVSCEPKYRFFKNLDWKPDDSEDKKWKPADYSQASYKVTLQETQELPFDVVFNGKNVRVQVEEGVNELGVPSSLISDVPDNDTFPFGYSFFQKMYISREGEQNLDSPEYIEFCAFFAKAYWAHIREKERNNFKTQGKEWKPPIINLNDAQSLLTSVFRLVDYLKAVETGNTEEADFLRSFMFSATTHTYKNRGFAGYEQNREKLISYGIPANLHWLFGFSASLDPNLPSWGDFNPTSAGLNASDVTKAVSALHAKEVFEIDPALQALYGITNGDLIANSSKYFRQYLKDLFPDALYPEITKERVETVKRKAKKEIKHQGISLGLNPDQCAVGYSGRWVSEKCCKRGFDLVELGNDQFASHNIEAMVKEGIQVVIYGNVQAYDTELGRRWDKVAEHIQKLKSENPSLYPGNFIFKSKFTLEEQLQLLAALDLQIQDSDRSTGASEYTESNATANGALSMGSPYHEGIINKHGIPINFSNPGWGNTLVPENESREAYLKEFLKVNDLFKSGGLFSYQANSIRLSQILQAEQTSAANLRLWASYYDSASPLYYKNRPLPGPSDAYHPPKASFHRVMVYKLKDGEEILIKNGGLSFFEGDSVILDIECNPNGSPTPVQAYLKSPDGTRIYLNAYPGNNRFKPFIIPEGISGEFQLFLVSGRSVEPYPQKIIFKSRPEAPYYVKRTWLPNGDIELIITFPKHHVFFRGTIVGEGISAWEGKLPEGVNFFGKNYSSKDENLVDFEMQPFIDTRNVQIIIKNPKITHIEFVTREENQRYHDNDKNNYSVPVRRAEEWKLIPTIQRHPSQVAA
jgi:hypothetical protein